MVSKLSQIVGHPAGVRTAPCAETPHVPESRSEVRKQRSSCVLPRHALLPASLPKASKDAHAVPVFTEMRPCLPSSCSHSLSAPNWASCVKKTYTDICSHPTNPALTLVFTAPRSVLLSLMPALCPCANTGESRKSEISQKR